MIPKNEMGVIVLFAQDAHKAGFKIVEIGTAFPDALIERGGRIHRAEFEFVASNFWRHKHDPRECDVIICWEDDDQTNTMLPVIALSNPDWFDVEIKIPSDQERELAYWKMRALAAESQINYSQVRVVEKVKNLAPTGEGPLGWATSNGGIISNKNLIFFISQMFSKGLQRNAWVPGVLDRPEYDAIMDILVEAGIVVGRTTGSAGRLVVASSDEAAKILGIQVN